MAGGKKKASDAHQRIRARNAGNAAARAKTRAERNDRQWQCHLVNVQVKAAGGMTPWEQACDARAQLRLLRGIRDPQRERAGREV